MKELEKLVVIGCSMGGLKALKQLFTDIKPHPNLSFIVVQHMNEGAKMLLPKLISERTDMPCLIPENNDPVEGGKIYFSKAACHLIVHEGCFRYGKGAPLNNAKPSIDQLFLSAAVSFQEKVIGIMLTGLLNDGTNGMQHIKRYGGTTIVQDPEDAEYSEMPANALKKLEPDFILPLGKIASAIELLLGQVKAKAELAAQKEDMERIRFALRQKETQVPVAEDYSQEDSLLAVLQMLQEHCNMLENMTENYLLRENKMMAIRTHRRLQVVQAHTFNLQQLRDQQIVLQTN